MTTKHYDKTRNHMEMDKAGGYYIRHVMALTEEDLHRKTEIAAELGHRDMVIDELRAELAALLGTQAGATTDTEAQGYALEAIWQFLPELPCRDDDLTVLTPAQLETLLRRLGWTAPCDRTEVGHPPGGAS